MIWGVVLTSGAGDVALWANQDRDLREISAAEALKLLAGQLLGVNDDAALAAAVRDAHDRALPGHPHREGFDLVERDVLVVADAALGRAAAEVVLHAVAGVDLDGPVVHLDREVDRQLAARLTEHAAKTGVQIEHLGGKVKLVLGDLPRIDGRCSALRRHGAARSSWWGGGRRPEAMGRLPDDPTGVRVPQPPCGAEVTANRLSYPSIATRSRL